MAEVLGLHQVDQPALVEMVELDRGQPRAQQAARVRGGQIGAGGAMAGVALAQQALDHVQHRAWVRTRGRGLALRCRSE